MAHLSEKIDWLALTYSPEQVANYWPTLENSLRSLEFHAPMITHCYRESFYPAQPRYGYSKVLSAEAGTTIYYNGPDSLQGLHIRYPGGALEHYQFLGMIDLHLTQGARVTRLDYAVDLHNDEMPIELMFDMLKNRENGNEGPRAITRTQRYSMLSGSTGATLYIGSRASTKLVRIYDKRAQMQENGPDHWRVEIECKDSVAHNAALRVMKSGADSLRSLIKSAVHFPGVPQWELIVGNGAASPVKSDKKCSNTRNWLLERVALSVAKQWDIEYSFLQTFVETVVSMSESSWQKTLDNE